MDSPSLSDEIRDERRVAQAIRSLTMAATANARGFTTPLSVASGSPHHNGAVHPWLYRRRSVGRED